MAPFILKDWADQGMIPSPRVFPVGQLITGTGGQADELFIQRTAPQFEGSIVEARSASSSNAASQLRRARLPGGRGLRNKRR
jgi:hypothetical protein